MFPAEVESFTTDGEGKVYQFLRRWALPDDAFLAWYSPDIEDREPDFILFSPDCGLIVFEVKDWSIKQLVTADPKTAVLRIRGKQERRKQPLAQAKEYVHALMSFLGKRTTEWRNGKPALPCPIQCGAVFTNITRTQFEDSGLAQVMEGERVLCKDDLGESSRFAIDATGEALKKWLLEHFPPLFQFSLDEEKLNWLRGCIFPVVRIEVPLRGGATAAEENKVLALDQDQENLARNMDEGSTLILAPAGSGKSLILAHQAWYLTRVKCKLKRVLITCFNLSLVGYIRRLLARKGAPLGPDNIEVIPFYDLCALITGRPVSHENQNPIYYSKIVAEAREKVEKEYLYMGHWDAIMVDEGQDFSPDMMQLLVRLNPRRGIMTIAQDVNQQIYERPGQGWEHQNIPNLKVRHLVRQYRNSKPIATLSARILGIPFNAEHFAGSDGPNPTWIESKSWKQALTQVASAVNDLVRAGEPMSEIAILYVKSSVPQIKCMPVKMIELLERKGVLARWLSRDEESKRSYDITVDSVTISSVHSVKGMDYAHVFLLGLDTLMSGSEHDRRLGYVGMTRARESLTLVQSTYGSKT